MDKPASITDNTYMNDYTQDPNYIRMTRDNASPMFKHTENKLCDLCRTRPATIDVHEIYIVHCCDECNESVENDMS